MLAGGGALVSEHPPGTGGLPWMHAARNRLIAVHAEEVLLVEAAQCSGSLSTATWARRLGRPLWVAPAVVGGARAGLEDLLQAGHAAIYAPPSSPTLLPPSSPALSPASASGAAVGARA